MPESRSLRPLGGWDLVSRGRFEARHDGHVWTVDLDYFDFGEKLHLYRDGVEVEVQKSPAKFDLNQSATIEVAMGLLGMRPGRTSRRRRDDHADASARHG